MLKGTMTYNLNQKYGLKGKLTGKQGEEISWFSDGATYSKPKCNLCKKGLPEGEVYYTKRSFSLYIFFCSKECYRIYKLIE